MLLLIVLPFSSCHGLLFDFDMVDICLVDEEVKPM
jgi:hypothetical protein